MINPIANFSATNPPTTYTRVLPNLDAFVSISDILLPASSTFVALSPPNISPKNSVIFKNIGFKVEYTDLNPEIIPLTSAIIIFLLTGSVKKPTAD